MKSNLSKTLLAGVIALTSVVSALAQDKQYTLNDDKSQVSLIVDLKQTKFTVADVQYNKRGTAQLEAKIYKLGINMDTIGSWSALSGKDKIWKLNIGVPQAKGFFVRFDDFYIPEDAKLYVYNKNNTTDAVVYSHKDNPNGGSYSIENLSGDNVVLEYVVSENNKEVPRLLLSDVGYKYTDGNGEHTNFGTSATCMVNVNCPEAEGWQYEKKGVVLLRMQKTDNTYLCSGTLINNTNNDKTPYLLTADHCFEKMQVEQIPDKTSFIFGYEYPTCEIEKGAQPPRYKYHKGSEVLVLNPIIGGSDGALLKLSENIPDDWDVYFNGWDRENKASTGGVVIHHPKGDVKKISFYNEELTSGRWDATSPLGTHWLVTYVKGATQGGSSGGPIFNSAGLVVGTLTGGSNDYCNLTASDYYGKLWYHWDRYPDASKHMSQYLDPANTGATKWAGLNNNDDIEKNIVLDNSNLSIVLNESSEVTVLDGNGDYTVSSSDDKIAKAEINNKKITITALNFGTALVTVKDKKGKTSKINVLVVSTVKYAIDGANTLTVTLNKEEDSIKQVRIINLNGDTVIDKKGLDVKIQPIDISILPRDTYIIQTVTKNGIKKAEKITW